MTQEELNSIMDEMMELYKNNQIDEEVNRYTKSIEKLLK
jgi:hypothetical protein